MAKTTLSPNLFRSLDIRGASPDYVKSLKAEPGSDLANSAHGTPFGAGDAYIIGRAIPAVFVAKSVAVGYDSRLSSPKLAQALIRGLRRQGANVDLIGLSGTDKLYFAVGSRKYDIGVQITGSHTIKYLNGLKIVRYKNGKVLPVSKGLGMEKLRDVALGQQFPKFTWRRGKFRKIDISADFEQYILSHFDYQRFKPQKVVFDAGNGAAGPSFEKIIDQLPIEAIKMNFAPDGNFPHHEPDPIVASNIQALMAKIRESRADFGCAWDGDADRVAVVSSAGELVTGSFFAPMLLPWVLNKHAHATTVATISMSYAMQEVAAEYNAKVELSAVGNSNVTLAMDNSDAPFAAEEADHFMFRETFNAESGIFPLLILLDLIGSSGKTFDQLLAEAKKGYFISGDVNIEADDSRELVKKLFHYFQAEAINCQIRFGDLVVERPEYHFALHPSFNDPVIRLNLEAKSPEIMERSVREVAELVRKVASPKD